MRKGEVMFSGLIVSTSKPQIFREQWQHQHAKPSILDRFISFPAVKLE
jgi:ABC-type iron transport system FetAB ATPase subunit